MTKINYKILLPMILFFIISMLSIYSASVFSSNNVLTKQLLWYLIGFVITLVLRKKHVKLIIDNAILLYICINILLFLLLILGQEINGSKCWFVIPGIGSFQPSEFTKLILIIVNAKTLNYFDKKYKTRTIFTDIKIFLTIMILTLIPSILTFLQPDTGIVIIYFLISFIMLFCFGIKKSIFICLITLFLVSVGGFLYFYFNYENEFINIFGTNFFYRIDRLLDWSNKSGMQLSNALVAIKSSYLTGFGIKNTPIYIPEAHTDFIFSVFASNFGLIGSVILILTICYFDYNLLKIASKTKDKVYKFIIIGFLAMILYQQIQNIGMNIGLLPITGITLPFISYGGSSLISYMLGIAIILNYNNQKKHIKPNN